MKKISILTWLVYSCLLLTNTVVNGQSSKTSVRNLMEQILGKKEPARQPTVKGRPPVSRKRTPDTVPSRKREPSQTRERESDQQSGEENRKGEPTQTEEQETGRRPRQETRKRRRSDDSPRQERVPQRRERTDDKNYEDDHPSQGSKAKCGVPGCQHPGKHKGLHKQQKVVRPIRFGQ